MKSGVDDSRSQASQLGVFIANSAKYTCIIVINNFFAAANACVLRHAVFLLGKVLYSVILISTQPWSTKPYWAQVLRSAVAIQRILDPSLSSKLSQEPQHLSVYKQ